MDEIRTPEDDLDDRIREILRKYDEDDFAPGCGDRTLQAILTIKDMLDEWFESGADAGFAAAQEWTPAETPPDTERLVLLQTNRENMPMKVTWYHHGITSPGWPKGWVGLQHDSNEKAIAWREFSPASLAPTDRGSAIAPYGSGTNGPKSHEATVEE